MSALVEVLAGVPVRGRVAAAYVAAAEAQTQMHPAVAGPEAVFAAGRAGNHLADCAEMGVGHPGSLLWMGERYGRERIPPRARELGVNSLARPTRRPAGACDTERGRAQSDPHEAARLGHAAVRIEVVQPGVRLDRHAFYESPEGVEDHGRQLRAGRHEVSRRGSRGVGPAHTGRNHETRMEVVLEIELDLVVEIPDFADGPADIAWSEETGEVYLRRRRIEVPRCVLVVWLHLLRSRPRWNLLWHRSLAFS